MRRRGAGERQELGFGPVSEAGLRPAIGRECAAVAQVSGKNWALAQFQKPVYGPRVAEPIPLTRKCGGESAMSGKNWALTQFQKPVYGPQLAEPIPLARKCGGESAMSDKNWALA